MASRPSPRKTDVRVRTHVPLISRRACVANRLVDLRSDQVKMCRGFVTRLEASRSPSRALDEAVAAGDREVRAIGNDLCDVEIRIVFEEQVSGFFRSLLKQLCFLIDEV